MAWWGASFGGWSDRVCRWFTTSRSPHLAAHTLGQWGEKYVARLLIRDGMKLLHRNWRVGKRELDLVLVEGNTLVVVEVKTRRGGGPDGVGLEGEEVVSEAQVERVRGATEVFMGRHGVRLKRMGVVRYRIEVVVLRIDGREVRIRRSTVQASPQC